MKLVNIESKLELVIEDSLLNEIGQIGVKHFPNEFGGFLVGKYSMDRKSLSITGFILPRKYKATSILFERSTYGLKDVFIKLFEEKGEYFIGEWHTHPNGSTQYSNTDLKAMIKTVDSEDVLIKNPLLLILSISSKSVNAFTFYLYNKERLIKYE